MLILVAASMRYQHLDSTKTRDLTRDLIEMSSKDNRDLIEKSSKETRDLLRANHADLSGSLADARERLARIEGHFRISPPPQQGASGGDRDTRAA